ncbi:hypothetical protein LCGC14_1773510 [marine sediment metagenome]|uniref:Uncharacterized protein n=1 Tax=marine sediment metagenome TaxID=412755 RepID=A0A0F9GXH3_9ZZZZ
MKYSELYCKIHKLKLIHNRIIININTPIEIGYCSKCNKEYTEYSDINPIYISNYEWLIIEWDNLD